MLFVSVFHSKTFSIWGPLSLDLQNFLLWFYLIFSMLLVCSSPVIHKFCLLMEFWASHIFWSNSKCVSFLFECSNNHLPCLQTLIFFSLVHSAAEASSELFPFGLWNFSFNFNLNLIFSLFQPLHRISLPCPLVYLGGMWFRTCHQAVHFYLLQIHTETCIIFDFIEQSYSHFKSITINKVARKYVTLYRSVYNCLRSYCNMPVLIF